MPQTRKKQKRTCHTCHKEFFHKNPQKKYCSDECKKAGRDRKATRHTETRNKWILKLRDGFTCYMCGRNSAWDGVELDLDHIVPFSKGGQDVVGNVLCACTRCNRSRQDKSFHPDMEKELVRIAHRLSEASGLDPFQSIRIVR